MDRKLSRGLIAIVMLTVGSLACNAMSSLVDRPLLSENFEGDQTWGTGTDQDSSVEYSDGGLRMKVFTGNFIVWSTLNSDPYKEAIHIEVTVKNNGTDPLTAFGIVCDLQKYTDSFYYLAATPQGDFAIASKSLGMDSVYLTNDGGWGTSDAIAKDADSYRLGADCGNGVLTLYVDGKQIASVSDSTYTSGNAGLLLWSDEQVNKVDVTFDDFVVTKLK